MAQAAIKPTDSPFTHFLMVNYHIWETQQVCKCGSLRHTLLSQEVFVHIQHKDDHRSVPLREVLDRYQKHFGYTEEEARDVLPHLPLYVRQKILLVDWCIECVPDFYGQPDPKRAMPEMMPSVCKTPAAPIESPNADFDKRARALIRKRNASRKVKPKDLMREKIRFGSITNLLD